MKTKVLFIALFLLSFCRMIAQVPQGFTYQAIARSASGDALANTEMKVKLGILPDTNNISTMIWEEEHLVRTNQYGLITVTVGGIDGVKTGGSAESFAMINWAEAPLFIIVAVKNPASTTSYTPMGKAKIWSVPYSLISGQSMKDMSSPFLFNNDTIYLMQSMAIGSSMPYRARLAVVSEDDLSDDPLFEVRRKDGQPVFTVFNDAVTINVSKTPDVKNSPSRGGFAIGGFDETKGVTIPLFRVTYDSVKINIKNSPPAEKGSPSRGGFAIGGFDETKGSVTVFTSLTPENYFIGHLSGSMITTGLFNSVIGYESGVSLTTGESNSFIGYQSGYRNNTGSGNLFLGFRTGFSNEFGSYNSFLGYLAGHSNSTGVFNTFLGSFSGFSNTIGSNNTFVGDSTGYLNLSGFRNTFVGTGCGLNNQNGSENVFIGNQSGYRNISGEKNVFIGSGAGKSNTTGFNNVFIGNSTGQDNLTGFSNVIIGINAGLMFDAGVGNTFIGDNSGRNTRKSDKNVFLGAFCGYNDSNYEGESSSNVFIGNRAGYNSPGGNSNVFIGFDAGYSNSSSNSNVLIGFESGYKNESGNDNVYIGIDAGYNAIGGEGNTFMGSFAGSNTSSSVNNLFIGSHAGQGNVDGNLNVVLGSWAGAEGELGNGNVLLGMDAGRGGAGSSNIYIGNGAGSTFGGDFNICLGYATGVNQKGSGYFIVDSNSGDSTEVLLFGNFFQDMLRINGKVGIGTHPFENTDLSVNSPTDCGSIAVKGTGNPWQYSQIKLMSQEAELTKYWEINHTKSNALNLIFYDGVSTWTEPLNLSSSGVLTIGAGLITGVRLDVRGNAQFRSVGSGTYYAPLNITSDGVLTTATSDQRLKKDITTISGALKTVLALRGVRFRWIDDNETIPRIGFIAQDVEKVLPEVVFTNPVDGYKGINYAEVTAILVEAMKEQQRELEEYKSENSELRSSLRELQQKVVIIEEVLKKIKK